MLFPRLPKIDNAFPAFVPVPTYTNMFTSEKKGIVGLTNIGNTCYGNAVLQALRHQVHLTIYLLQDKHKELNKRKPVSDKTLLVDAYGQLVKHM